MLTNASQAVLHNWVREFGRWAPSSLRVVLYDGTPDERRALQRDVLDRSTFNVVVTNYELIMRDKAALRKVGRTNNDKEMIIMMMVGWWMYVNMCVAICTTTRRKQRLVDQFDHIVVDQFDHIVVDRVCCGDH